MALVLEKYILYGASFNPPHIGHFSAIRQMLEEYDNVIVFPYPKKFSNGKVEPLPAISQRMTMLEIFFAEFFPQIKDRLILTDFATELIKTKTIKGMPHTYDYLQYAKTKIPEGADLSVCLGFDASNELRKEAFYKEEDIAKEFGIFRLEEENKIKSEDLRKFFSSHKNLSSAKDERYIRSAVGDNLAEHIFKNNLYGLKKKKSKVEEDSEPNIKPNKLKT